MSRHEIDGHENAGHVSGVWIGLHGIDFMSIIFMSVIFMSVNFVSVNFMPGHLVRQFHVRHFQSTRPRVSVRCQLRGVRISALPAVNAYGTTRFLAIIPWQSAFLLRSRALLTVVCLESCRMKSVICVDWSLCYRRERCSIVLIICTYSNNCSLGRNGCNVVRFVSAFVVHLLYFYLSLLILCRLFCVFLPAFDRPFLSW